jgi:hypothetical protein
MPKYAVLLNVSGLILVLGRELKSGGLCAWRCVEAESKFAAAAAAVENLTSDPEYVVRIWNGPEDRASFQAIQIDELEDDFDLSRATRRIDFWFEPPDMMDLALIRTQPIERFDTSESD